MQKLNGKMREREREKRGRGGGERERDKQLETLNVEHSQEWNTMCVCVCLTSWYMYVHNVLSIDRSGFRSILGVTLSAFARIVEAAERPVRGRFATAFPVSSKNDVSRLVVRLRSPITTAFNCLCNSTITTPSLLSIHCKPNTEEKQKHKLQTVLNCKAVN